MRHAVTLLWILALPALGAADEPAAPSRLDLKGAPATVVPPDGAWTKRETNLAADQWLVEFRRADLGAWMQTRVFPARDTLAPDRVLSQAVDTLFRGLGVEGFGLPAQRPLDLWGVPGAEARVAAVLGVTPVKGWARLLRLNARQWVFAVGLAPQAADEGVHAAIQAHVQSLEPKEPAFYEVRFHAGQELERVVAQPEGEPPVTVADVAGVEALLEAGIGDRFSLRTRAEVRRILEDDARQGSRTSRDGFRAAREAVLLDPKGADPERLKTWEAIGGRVLQAILDRTREGYRPAMRFTLLWKEMRSIAVGTKEDGLPVQVFENLLEMSAFLASVAADRAVQVDAPRRRRLEAVLRARWNELAAEEKAALGEADVEWAALRYAWDEAEADARATFRRAVTARLAPVGDRAHVEGLVTSRALKGWMAARSGDGLEDGLLDAAWALGRAEQSALRALLGVEAEGYRFGW